jgi:hypothetical protein
MPPIVSTPWWETWIFSKTLPTRRRRCITQVTNNRQEVDVFSWMKPPSSIKYSCQDHNNMLLITKLVMIRLIAYLIMKPSATWILSIMINPTFLNKLRDIRHNCTMKINSKMMNVPKIDNSFSSNLFSKLQKYPLTNSKTRGSRNMVGSWHRMIPMLSYQEATR